jgi:hydrogenase maturation protease
MDPAKVLALATHLGDEPLPRVLVLACEPAVLPSDDDLLPGLSATVREAVGRAVDALHVLLPALLEDPAAPLPPLGHPMESGTPRSAALPGTAPGGAEDR